MTRAHLHTPGQIVIDWDRVPERKQNNPESQQQLDKNLVHFGQQCARIFSWLMEGKEVSSLFCSRQNPPIVDTRARIRDLKKVNIKLSERKAGAHKIWFMTPEQRQANEQIYKAA